MGKPTGFLEKNPRSSGLLAYGIPDFKLGNQLIDRRLALPGLCAGGQTLSAESDLK